MGIRLYVKKPVYHCYVIYTSAVLDFTQDEDWYAARDLGCTLSHRPTMPTAVISVRHGKFPYEELSS